MDPSFWKARWQAGQIGFHQERVHPALHRYEQRFLKGGPHRVLVPLCGKSLDLAWLASQGHEVVGVELVETAVRAFFDEQQITPRVEEREGLRAWGSDGLTVLQADVLQVTPERVGSFDRVWDRAAMVALPPEVRPAYVERVRNLVAPGGAVLLETFAYDTSRMEGPPFSVSDEEVRDLYGGWGIKVLERQDAGDEPRWRERGLEEWWVTTWLLRAPGSPRSM